MKESMGGAWLFGIVITFIAFFAAFLSYSISYTKAFNVKNQIIDYIEQNEGYSSIVDSSDPNEDSVQAKAENYMKKVGYNSDAASQIICNTNDKIGGVYSQNMNGYCLEKVCQSGSTTSNFHYKVTTFICLEIPIIGFVINLPISGETRTIYSLYDGTAGSDGIENGVGCGV